MYRTGPALIPLSKPGSRPSPLPGLNPYGSRMTVFAGVGIPSGPAENLLGNLLRSNLILSTLKIISSSIKLNAPACNPYSYSYSHSLFLFSFPFSFLFSFSFLLSFSLSFSFLILFLFLFLSSYFNCCFPYY